MTNLTHKVMQNKFLIVLFMIMVVSTNIIHAQNPFRIELFGGSSLNLDRDIRLFSNWGNGYIIGGGVVKQLFPSFDLAMDIAYHRYPYKGGSLELVTLDILGLEQSVSGSGSNILECSLSFRNSPKQSKFYPIFSLRIGAFRTHIGEIIISEWYNQAPQNIINHKYSNTGIIQTNIFAALGLGFSIPVKENSRVILESRIAQTFDLKQTFIPIVLTLQHDFK